MARFIASRRIVGWERGGDKPADEWDRAILDDGAFVAASDLPDAPSAASTPPEIKHRPPKPMVSRERTLHYWLARLVSYPRWVSIGSIDSHAELQRISREDYETIQEVLRGE